jgi:hypothetical protein
MKITERGILSTVILLIGFGLGYFARDLREWSCAKSQSGIYAPEIGTLFNDDLPKDLEIKLAAYIQALNERDYKAAAKISAACNESGLSIARREREYKNQFRQEDRNTNPWEYYRAGMRDSKDPKTGKEREYYIIELRQKAQPLPAETRRVMPARDFDYFGFDLVRIDGQWYFAKP